MSNQLKVDVFGDSVMKGMVWDTQTNAYRLLGKENWNALQTKFPIELRNRARVGSTIEKGELLLRRSLDAGLDCDAVLLEYGGNDTDYDWPAISETPEAEHLPKTPLPVFEAVYRRMIALLKKSGITPVVMSLPPIDAEKYFSWFSRGLNAENLLRWLGDKQTIYRHQELYSRTAARVAQETGSLFVDIRPAFLESRRFGELLCADGIHPTACGHLLIREAFERFLGGIARERCWSVRPSGALEA